MAKILDKTGITTGNTVEAYHVTQSIDAFSGLDAYDITLSGSFTMTGSIDAPTITGSLYGTASWAENCITSSYLSGSVTSASYAATASYFSGTVVSSSYAVTASHAQNAISASYALSASFAQNSISASYAVTASHVNLVAGPNITINKTNGVFAISASATNTSITWTTFTDFTPNYNIYLSSSYGYINQAGNTHNGYLILPASASLGDTFQYIGSLAGNGTSDLIIYQTRTNERIYIEGYSSTLGTSGYLTLTDNYKQASYTFTCIQAGTPSIGHKWVISSVASTNPNCLDDLGLSYLN